MVKRECSTRLALG